MISPKSQQFEPPEGNWINTNTWPQESPIKAVCCQRCEDTGVLGITNSGVPVTCNCEIGANAKEANSDWYTLSDVAQANFSW